MRISVVVRSKDEAPRLRLSLASLARQTVTPEVIVVDDGSSDETAEVIAEASGAMALKAITHRHAQGRSAAANAGARAASGDILLFVDGDNLIAPDCVARHAAAHQDGRFLIGRGETYHLRGTRFFRDPEAGAPWPETAAHVARLSPDERARLRITRRQVMDDFQAIAARGEPGVYPGAGPRLLYALEMEALRHSPDCTVLWAAASGCNLSVPRAEFLDSGGYDEAIDINEHRELALRLCRKGGRMMAVEGARSYHLTHRSGWRDPLIERNWERAFHRAHPIPEVRLLTVFWAGLSSAHRIPPEARIASLPDLERAARGETSVDYDAVWRALGGRDASGTAVAAQLR